jgi:predicted nucleic acid-binding protein
MKIALDTNVLAYSEQVEHGPADAPKIGVSRSLLRGLVADMGTVPVAPAQALIELHHVLTRKAGRSREDARLVIQGLVRGMELAPTTGAVIADALDVASTHRLQIFDAIILAASAAVGCDLLVSEDLQHGFRFKGVMVTNPFGEKAHAVIRALSGQA